MSDTSAEPQDLIGRRMGGAEMVARKYDSGKRTILRWADAGLIPFGTKLGGRRLWNLDEIDTHIAKGCPRCRDAKRGAK